MLFSNWRYAKAQIGPRRPVGRPLTTRPRKKSVYASGSSAARGPHIRARFLLLRSTTNLKDTQVREKTTMVKTDSPRFRLRKSLLQEFMYDRSSGESNNGARNENNKAASSEGESFSANARLLAVAIT